MDFVTYTLAKKYFLSQKGAPNGVAAISNGAVVLPSYPTISRPAVTIAGSVIFDSTLGKCIVWNGSAWVNLNGTAL